MPIEKVMEINLNEILADYDEKLFFHLQKRDYDTCEQMLTDFCLELLELTDEEQVFIARVFFVGLITDIIRRQSKKNRPHPGSLFYAYAAIAEIEKWSNMSVYLVSIRWLLEEMRERIIGSQIIIQVDRHIEKALKIIDDDLKGNGLTVASIAAKLHISPTHLGNLFKLTVGEPISRYIIHKKLDEIIFEMMYTNKTLKEIREEFGFHNHSHFIQHFKQHIGMTPLQYKKQLMD